MKIIQGKRARPRRVVFYGVHGIGKSTWAAHAPSPIFLTTEDGLDDIGVDRTPMIRTLGEFNAAVSDLVTQPHDYRTVVVDSIDWLEQLIWKTVADEKNKDSIDEISYFRGYGFALKHWAFVLSSLEHLRNERNIGVILIAHAKSMKIDPPDGESFNRYEPDLHKTVAPLIQEWADEVLFARYKVDAIKKGEGFNERTIAIGGERTVYTCESPAHLAKRRIAMPDTIAMDWNVYANHIKEAQAGHAGGNINGTVVDGSSKPKETNNG